MKRFLLITGTLGIFLFSLGYAQYNSYAERNTIEWAYQAYDVKLNFNPDEQFHARFVFIGVTEFGVFMTSEYLNMVEDKSTLSIRPYGSGVALAVNDELLQRYRYLDMYAYLEAYCLYFWYKVLLGQ